MQCVYVCDTVQNGIALHCNVVHISTPDGSIYAYVCAVCRCESEKGIRGKPLAHIHIHDIQSQFNRTIARRGRGLENVARCSFLFLFFLRFISVFVQRAIDGAAVVVTAAPAVVSAVTVCVYLKSECNYTTPTLSAEEREKNCLIADV